MGFSVFFMERKFSSSKIKEMSQSLVFIIQNIIPFDLEKWYLGQNSATGFPQHLN